MPSNTSDEKKIIFSSLDFEILFSFFKPGQYNASQEEAWRETDRRPSCNILSKN